MSKTIELDNVIGYFNSNRVAQPFYAGLLNLLFGQRYDFQDLDLGNGTLAFAGIDISDVNNGIAIQVTAEKTSTKIKDTIAMFLEKEYYKQYDTLIILMIGKQLKYTTEFDTNGLFVFDKNEHIRDDGVLIKKINQTTDLDILNRIEQYLQKNLESYKTPSVLFQKDIKDCISLIGEKFLGTEDIKEVVTRGNDFMAKKNIANNISEDFFVNNIQVHLEHNKAIEDFLKDPINIESQNLYFRVVKGIQDYYFLHKEQFKSFEDMFKTIFSNIELYNHQTPDISKKVSVILHNMYFNCDIGDNPNTDA